MTGAVRHLQDRTNDDVRAPRLFTPAQRGCRFSAPFHSLLEPVPFTLPRYLDWRPTCCCFPCLRTTRSSLRANITVPADSVDGVSYGCLFTCTDTCYFNARRCRSPAGPPRVYRRWLTLCAAYLATLPKLAFLVNATTSLRGVDACLNKALIFATRPRCPPAALPSAPDDAYLLPLLKC